MLWLLVPLHCLCGAPGFSLHFGHINMVLFFSQTLRSPCLFCISYFASEFGGLFLQLSCKKYSDLLFPVKHLGSVESSPIHFTCCCWLAFSLGTHSHRLMSPSPWMDRSQRLRCLTEERLQEGKPPQGTYWVLLLGFHIVLLDRSQIRNWEQLGIL